ncbi:MAG: hypothetical protein QOI28_21 [Mycobacterium sp.]|nr:hypothetical protein [Mycobacterium sp.]
MARPPYGNDWADVDYDITLHSGVQRAPTGIMTVDH